jgi:GrpB-like predicted nucleotidyltransferase (UPF0157 family)
MLTIRDRLRKHPDERDLYERTKRELAARKWTYVQDYADAKASVVEAIITRGRCRRALCRRSNHHQRALSARPRW